MKNLKAICLVIGLIELILMILSFTPLFLNDSLNFLILFRLSLNILACVICIKLAREINRSTVGWGIFSFLMPYIACFILPFLEEREENISESKIPSTSTSVGGGSYSSASYGAGYSGSSFMSSKTCGKCGRNVSSVATVGQRCSHCGAYWSYERKTGF